MASVDSTHTQGACGGESIDSPTVSIFHSPTIDVEYVFVSSNTVTFLKITLMNDYLLSNQEVNLKFSLSVNLWFLVISIISIGYELT